MNGRKLSPAARAVLIIIIFIAILILFENLIRMLANVTERTSIKIEENKEKEQYQQTEEYQQEVYIENSITEAMELIQNKDYEKLLAVLHPDYKDAMGIDSVEKFKEHFSEYFGNALDIQLLEHEVGNGNYYCTVSVKLENENLNQKIVVTPNDDGTFYMVFDEIVSMEKFDDYLQVLMSGVRYKLINKVLKGTDSIISFDVKNEGTTAQVVSLDKMYLVRSNRENYYPTNTEELMNISIAPGETKRIRCIFDISDDAIYYDYKVVFVATNSAGKTIESSVTLEDF